MRIQAVQLLGIAGGKCGHGRILEQTVEQRGATDGGFPELDGGVQPALAQQVHEPGGKAGRCPIAGAEPFQRLVQLAFQPAAIQPVMLEDANNVRVPLREQGPQEVLHLDALVRALVALAHRCLHGLAGGRVHALDERLERH